MRRQCRTTKKDDISFQLASSFGAYQDIFQDGPRPSDGLPSGGDEGTDRGANDAAIPILTTPDAMVTGLMTSSFPGTTPTANLYFASCVRTDGLTDRQSHITACQKIIDQPLIPIGSQGSFVPGLPFVYGSLMSPNNSIFASTTFTTAGGNNVMGDTLVLTASGLINQVNTIMGSEAFGFSVSLPNGVTSIDKPAALLDAASILVDVMPYKDYSYYYNVFGFVAGAGNVQAMNFASAPLYLMTIRNGNARPLSRFMAIQVSYTFIFYDRMGLPKELTFNAGFTLSLNVETPEVTLLIQDLSAASKSGSVFRPSFTNSNTMRSAPAANNTTYLAIAMEVSGAADPTITLTPISQSCNFLQAYSAALSSRCTK